MKDNNGVCVCVCVTLIDFNSLSMAFIHAFSRHSSKVNPKRRKRRRSQEVNGEKIPKKMVDNQINDNNNNQIN